MFKRLVIPALILAIAVPAFAQRPRQQRLKQRPAVRANAIRKGMNLTEEQKQTLRALREGNRTQRQTLMQDTRQKAQALRDLLSQANPNPTDVGNAALALKQARARARELRQQTMKNFRNNLTPEQLKQFRPRLKP